MCLPAGLWDFSSKTFRETSRNSAVSFNRKIARILLKELFGGHITKGLIGEDGTVGSLPCNTYDVLSPYGRHSTRDHQHVEQFLSNSANVNRRVKTGNYCAATHSHNSR